MASRHKKRQEPNKRQSAIEEFLEGRRTYCLINRKQTDTLSSLPGKDFLMLM